NRGPDASDGQQVQDEADDLQRSTCVHQLDCSQYRLGYRRALLLRNLRSARVSLIHLLLLVLAAAGEVPLWVSRAAEPPTAPRAEPGRWPRTRCRNASV